MSYFITMPKTTQKLFEVQFTRHCPALDNTIVPMEHRGMWGRTYLRGTNEKAVRRQIAGWTKPVNILSIVEASISL